MSHKSLKLTVAQIQELAAGLVEENPGGIRFSEIVARIRSERPETPLGTVATVVSELAKKLPTRVSKPSRGLFVPANASGSGKTESDDKPPEPAQERAFYRSFAEFLLRDLDEVTVADELGGAGLKTKWGTPDVVGVYRAGAGATVKFESEIVSAELKIDPRASIEAFGQAIAYRLFSTKSYVVMPNTIPGEDLGRLESLCMLFGIGLVLFTPDPGSPEWETRTKAQRFSPDMFYVNEFADRLKQHKRDLFEKLFG